MSNTTSNPKLFKKYSFYNSNSNLDISTLPLNANSFKVFHYILKHLEFGNLIALNQTECSQDLRMSRSKIHASLKALTEHGIIRRLPKKSGTTCVYQLNPTIAYRGTQAKYSITLDSFLGLNTL